MSMEPVPGVISIETSIIDQYQPDNIMHRSIMVVMYDRQGKNKSDPSVWLIIMDDRIHHSPQTLNGVMVESGASPKLDVF